MINIELDLEKIDDLARRNWEDNWNFREFLLKHPDPPALDKLVQQLNQEISSQIDCTTCGNCCREAQPQLSNKDVSRITKALALKNQEFRQRHVAHNERGEQFFAALPCPLLKSTLCSIYLARPDDCRSYPHLHKANFLARSVSIIENYRVCPIVFNVYEELKSALGYDPNVDHIGDKVIDE